MAVPPRLLQQLLCAGPRVGGVGRVTVSTSCSRLPTIRAYVHAGVRASKKRQSASTKERDGGDRGRSRKEGTLAEPASGGDQGWGGNGGGAQARQQEERGGSTSTTMEMDLNKTIAACPGPKPPVGFIVNEEGAVVLVATAANRVITIDDPSSQRPLECMIRRAFRSSDGRECLLLLPLDMPLQILKIDEETEGLTDVRLGDEELQEILPSAVYALAKRRLHLIVSGFCLTARGGFCYTEEHVLDFKAEYGEGLGGSLTEGVVIANFQVASSEYIVYTPFDPVMFVVHRDEASGQLEIADDELLDDKIVLDAIDEENEFQALVDEEDAMHETLREAK